MNENHFSKTEMARRMQTRRAALDRFLDSENDAVHPLHRLKSRLVIGRQIRIEFMNHG